MDVNIGSANIHIDGAVAPPAPIGLAPMDEGILLFFCYNQQGSMLSCRLLKGPGVRLKSAGCLQN